jgi:hypothetical protein
LAQTSVPVISAPEPAKVCIHTRQIVNDTSPDARTILFTMRDGSVWRNSLQSACPDLKFNGFRWTVRFSDEVCDNDQSITVLQSGQVCQLGRFTQVTPAK